MPVQSTQWIFDPVGYMKTNFKRYGDIFKACVLWGNSDPLIMVNDPKAVQYILTHDMRKELTSPGDVNKLLEPMVGKTNMMLLSGTQHQNRRQLVLPLSMEIDSPYMGLLFSKLVMT